MALIKSVRGFTPEIGENCFLADNATIIGDVKIGNDCSVWFSTVLRGDVNSIRIGNGVNIQDGSVLHTLYQKSTIEIGDHVSVGHNVTIHGATIKDYALIGMGSTILDHAVVGEGAIVAAGSLVLSNTVIEPGSIWGGVPAKFIKKVDPEQAKELNEKIGILRVTVVGDTRFDRVLQIREEAKDLPLVEKFKGNNAFSFVAGSSWGPDEDLFLEYFNNHPDMKLIIAPHVIDENHLVEIIGKLKRPYVRYTRADEKNVLKADCLIIDCFGLLSSIYRYGEIAYIGGGFGVGIHNTLEAAVYGIPVIFGPKYQKFMEAVQLLEAKGAYSIKDYEELKSLLDRFQTDKDFLDETGKNAGYYVTSKSGATEKIMNMINF